MALFVCKDLITAADYIRTTRHYSTPQSLWRAIKKGHQHTTIIGGLHFMQVPAESVAALHGIAAWQGLPVVSPLPGGLEVLSRISKKVGVGEAVILGWALLNRMDAYWVGGHFMANMLAAQAIAPHETTRKATHTKTGKVRRKRNPRL